MKARKISPTLKIELRIAAGDINGIVDRWRYGRDILREKAGRKQLPHGRIAGLIKEADEAGRKLTEREIQRRIRCAEVYVSEAQVRRSGDALGSWTALHEAGFPVVEPDERDLLDELANTGATEDEYEQLSLIPGLAPELKISGRRVRLADATVGDIKAYRDTYRQIHDNFGKTLAQIEIAVEAMDAGSGGDDATNAVEAWNRATGRPSLRVVAA